MTAAIRQCGGGISAVHRQASWQSNSSCAHRTMTRLGTRMNGDRLCHQVDWERAKLAAAAVLLSPFTPLLFMGEEYAEPAPFQYHVSHSDPELQRAVSNGRKQEFKHFVEAGVEPPDPQSEDTFLRSKLRTDIAAERPHAIMHEFYAELIRTRKALAPLRPRRPEDLDVISRAAERVVEFESRGGTGAYRVVLNFDEDAHSIHRVDSSWRKLLDSSDARWSDGKTRPSAGDDGSGSYAQPLSCSVFVAD